MRSLGQMILFLAVMSLAAYQYLENQTIKDEFTAKLANIQSVNTSPQMIYVYSLEEAMVGINDFEITFLKKYHFLLLNERRNLILQY